MADKARKPRVAVIGLGLTGVATLKNLLEEGFLATGFERNDYVGGLWKWSLDQSQTTAIKSTRTNLTRQKSCYQDFSFPNDLGDYPTAEQTQKYIEDYAKHFDIFPKCRFGITIEGVERSDHDSWTLRMVDRQNNALVEDFDKVVVTTGPFSKAWSPTVEGEEHFRGRILHGQAYKDPQDFAGQRVVVVGLSNTGGDIAVDLCGVADKVYISHRTGVRIIKRTTNGRAIDHRISRRVTNILMSINETIPTLATSLGTVAFDRNMRKTFPQIKPEWNLFPGPPIRNSTPIMNDYIIDKLAAGQVSSASGISHITPDSTIVFNDSTALSNIDAIIFATGYHFDFTPFSGPSDPTAHPTPEWENIPHTKGLPYPRLYYGIFPPNIHASSLAFIGPYKGHSAAAFSNADLSSQAIAQIWLGHHSLPPISEMEAWCDANYRSQLALVQAWRIVKVGGNPRELEKFLNKAAGNRMEEMLSLRSWWNRDAWRFWWNERKLYRLIMDGIDTPHVYRLFESERGENGRKKWEGAKEAIFMANGIEMK